MDRLLRALFLTLCLANYVRPQSIQPPVKEQKVAERKIKIDICKLDAEYVCSLNKESLKDINSYGACWKSVIEECLSPIKKVRTTGCIEQELTRFANVCLGKVCVNVEFTFKECVAY